MPYQLDPATGKLVWIDPITGLPKMTAGYNSGAGQVQSTTINPNASGNTGEIAKKAAANIKPDSGGGGGGMGIGSGIAPTVAAYGELAKGTGDMDKGQKGEIIGTAAGGTIGSIVEGVTQIPGIGALAATVGGIMGNIIGTPAQRRAESKAAKAQGEATYGAFHEQTNVDPYAQGNSAYMEDGGLTDMGLSMFMLNTRLPVKAKVNPLDTKLMTDHGHIPGSAPQSDMGDELQAYADGGFIGEGRLRAWAKARNMDADTVANKILRKRSTAKWMAAGGYIGGDDPKKPKPVPPSANSYQTAKEIYDANLQAQGIMGRRVNWDDPTQAYLARNAVVARKIGDPKVKFVYENGRPPDVQNLPTRLPPGISIDQVENTSEGYGYWHPQNGNFIKVDPSVYGTAKQPQPQTLAKFGGGGLTANKAREILHDGTVHGHPITDRQRRFFGAKSKGNTMKYAPGGITEDPPTKGKKKVVVAPDYGPVLSNLQYTFSDAPLQSNPEDPAKAIAYKKQQEQVKVEQKQARKVREHAIAGKPQDEKAPTFQFPTGESKRWDQMDWREKSYVSGRNLGSMKFDNWTDYVNPGVMISSMAEGLGTSPYEARRTDSYMPYVMGVGAPLVTGAIGGIGAKTTGQFINNLANPFAGTGDLIKGGVKKVGQIMSNPPAYLGTVEEMKALAGSLKNRIKAKPLGAAAVAPELSSAEENLLSDLRVINTNNRQYDKAKTLTEKLAALKVMQEKGAGVPDDAFLKLTGHDKATVDGMVARIESGALNPRPASYTDTSIGFGPSRAVPTTDVEAISNRVSNRMGPYQPGHPNPRVARRMRIRDESQAFLDELTLDERRTIDPAVLQQYQESARIELDRDIINRLVAGENVPISYSSPSNTFDTVRERFRQQQANDAMLAIEQPSYNMEGFNIGDITNPTSESLASLLSKKLDNSTTAIQQRGQPKMMPATRRGNDVKELVTYMEDKGEGTAAMASKMRGAYKTMANAAKGEKYTPAYSLSSDSGQMTYGLIPKFLKNDMIDLAYHGDDIINNLGVATQAGIDPEIIVKEMNKRITEINKHSELKIPFARIDPQGKVRYPMLSGTRKEEGGMVTSKNILYDHIQQFKRGGMEDYKMGGIVPDDYYAAGGFIDDTRFPQPGMSHNDYMSYAMGQMVYNDTLYDENKLPLMMKKGGWIKKAVNPAHKGYCTPMTKSTCTPRRKALARTFKKHHGFHKGEDGMMTQNDEGIYEQPEGMEQQQAPEAAQQQPQKPKSSVVNIELGELVVDPNTGEIIKEFKNSSRYSPHSDNPMKEPSGNFVTLPTQVVVIPKKLAKGYKEGNKLTQSTMLRQILMDQMKRKTAGEEEITPAPAGAVPQAQGGGIYGDPPYGDPPDAWSDMMLLNSALDPRTAEAEYRAKMAAANAVINGPGQAVVGSRKFPAAPGYDPNQPFVPSSTMPATKFRTPSEMIAAKQAGELYPGQSFYKKSPVERIGMTDLDRMLGRSPDAQTRFSNMATGATGNVLDNPDLDYGNTERNPRSAMGLIQGMQFLPAAMQLMESMRGNPDLHMHTNRGFDEARTYANQLPTDVNYDAAKAMVGRQMNARNRALMNFRRSDVAGDMAAAYGEGINRIGDIEMQEYNQEEQLKGAKLKALSDIAVNQGADFENAQREYDLAKEQDAAARRTLKNSAISESVSRVAKNYMDMEKIKAGNQMTDLFEANPYLKEMIQDKPGGVQFMVDYLNSVNPGANYTPEEVTSIMNETSTTVNPQTGRAKSITNRRRVYTKPKSTKKKD